MLIFSFFLLCSTTTFAQVDTSAQNQQTKKVEQTQSKIDTLPSTGTTKQDDLAGATPSVYVYKLKNRKMKSKFWYHPNEHQQSLDYYIAEGWSVVKMKKLEKPPLMEKVVALSQVILPIVKDSLKKEGN